MYSNQKSYLDFHDWIEHLTFRKWTFKGIFVWFFFFHHTPCYRNSSKYLVHSSKMFLSTYIELKICSAPFHSFTQLCTSRTYVAKIKAHINYAVHLPILIPIHSTEQHIIHSWNHVSYNDHMLNYLLNLSSTFYSHSCLNLLLYY